MVRYISILLFVCSAVFSQSNMMIVYTPTIITDTIIAEDDFQALSDGSLNSQGSWTTGYGTVTVSTIATDKRIGPGNADANSVAYHSATLNASMACEVSVDSTQGGRGLGPAVNVDGDDCYAWYSTTVQSYLVKIVNGSESTLATGTAWARTDVVQLWRYGNSLYCYRNGSLDTSIDTDGIETLAEPYLTGTKAGVGGYASGYGLADNWKAWNVSW